jgi:peptidoglycan/LPS O-acetylase OafA/YrhL
VTAGHRRDIDGLRAVAILPVMLYHARVAGFGGGFVGVDVFFVISGYLITGLIVRDLDEGRFSLAEFWLRRARRILPAVTVMMAVGLAIGWFVLLPGDYQAAARSAFHQSFFISNYYFWRKTGYFFESAETMPFLHTWSLSVEEQFYVVYPLLLLVLTRVARAHRTAILGALLMLSLGLSIWRLGRSPEEAFYLAHLRAWELLVGAVTASLAWDIGTRWSPPPIVREAASIAGLIAIACSVALIDRNTPFPGLAALGPCLGAALVIWANGYGPTAAGRLLGCRPFVAIGVVSYSLYLWHWPLLVYANYSSIDGRSTSFLLGVLLASAAVAWASYRWVETPIRRRAVLASTWRFVPAAATAVAIVAATGDAIARADGAPSRLAPDVYAAYREALVLPSDCTSVRLSLGVTACGPGAVTRPPDLIVWGDSHSSRLMPLVANLADASRFNVWLFRCPPVLHVYAPAIDGADGGKVCEAAEDALLRAIEAQRVRNVLLVSYWTQYTEGRDVLTEGPRKVDPFYSDATTHATSIAQARGVFRAHFVETVQSLRARGVEVWIMKEVPTHRYWVANQVAKVLRFGGDPDRIGRPLAELAERRRFVDSVFAEVAGPHVHILDPAPFLCDGSGFCHAAEGGRALYSDYHHLTPLGAMKLRPLIEPIFEQP